MPSAAIVSSVGVLNSFLRVTCLPFLSCCVQLTLISPQPMSSTRTKIMLGLAPETCAGMVRLFRYIRLQRQPAGCGIIIP